MTNPTWLRRFHPAPSAAAQLVCFPHAGGSASAFFAYSRDLPELDVLAVQYPGRQDRIREPFARSAGELADQVAAELLPLLDRPTALLGHSMGTLVAFEVARRLQEAGRPPLALFVSGRRAPSAVAAELEQHLLSDEALLEVVRGLGGPGAELLDDDELAAMFLPVIRADYRIVETYRPEASVLSCPLVVLNGVDDELVGAAGAQAWTAHSSAGTQLHWYPGGHFYLMDDPEPVRRTVAGAIERLLSARARA